MSNLKVIQVGETSKVKEEKTGKIKVMKIEKPMGIIVRTDGVAEEILLEKGLDVDNINWEPFKMWIKTKGKGGIDRECDWEMPNGLLVSMFGWTKGKEEIINKFELPPPVDMELYYGDLIFIGTIKGLPINFNIEKFEEFYSEAFGGFEDLEDNESEPDEQYEDSDSFIIEDHDSEPESETTEEEDNGDELSEIEDSEIEDSENEHCETEESDSEDSLSEFEYRSLMEEELESDEVKKLKDEIEKISEDEIIENCLGNLYVGYANDELCILSETVEDERWGEEIKIRGIKVVLVPSREE